MVEANPD